MNIESAKYVQDMDGNNNIIEVVIDGITMCVPINPDNRHYKAILEWVAEGNTIEEAE
jgi:hypothetical protein